MVVDCTCAGLTRAEGNIQPIDISKETLDLAITNTIQLIKDHVKVVQ